MSLKFDCHAAGSWPLKVQIALSEGSISEQLFETTAWGLEIYLDSSWQEVSANEYIKQIALSDNGGLDFNFSHLGGLYRLECLLPTVDPDYKYIYFRQSASERDPFYIVMEGLDFQGSNIIPSAYFDSSSLPSSLSQQLKMLSGVSTSGSMEISLVDIEDNLTKAFKLRDEDTPINLLSSDCSEDDETIYTENNDDFSDSGFIFIDNEAIHYSTKNIDGSFTNLVRGSLGTIAQDHKKNSYVTSHSCYFQGRHLWVKKPAGDRYSDDDKIIFSGTIESLAPSSANLACYSIIVNDPMVYLNCNFSNILGYARILPQLYISGEDTGSGRRGNDTLYLRRLTNALDDYEDLTIRVPQGFYLTTSDTLGDSANLATYLQKAINSAWPSSRCSIKIEDDGKILLSFNINYIIEVLDKSNNETDKDSILETLGFNDEKIVFSNISAFGTSSIVPKKVFVKADSSIRKGTGRYNRKIYLEDNFINYSMLEKFQHGHIAKIDDELVYYE